MEKSKILPSGTTDIKDFFSRDNRELTKAASQLVPNIVDHTDRMGRTYDVYSRLFKERIIIFTDEINTVTASVLIAQILALEADDNTRHICIYINSGGGSVYDAFMILDTMYCVKSPIEVYGFGMVASAATLILVCGSKGKRYLLPRTRVLIHQPMGGSRGQASDMDIAVKEILFIKEEIVNIYLTRTLMDEEEIRKQIDRDTYLSAESALQKGFIDHILPGNFDRSKK